MKIPDSVQLLAERTLLASLHIHKWHPRRTDKKVTREVIDQKHADNDAGRFIKNLLPEKAMLGVQKVETAARGEFTTRTRPWRDEGWRILPAIGFLDYTKAMQKHREDFDGAVVAFLKEYPVFCHGAQARLKDLYRAEDYPEESEIKRAFAFIVDYAPVSTAEDFRVSLPDGQMQLVQESYTAAVEESVKQARADLWGRLATPLQTLVTKLRTTEAKAYHATLVTNLKDMLKLVPTLMYENDPELSTLLSETQQELGSLDIADIRDKSRVRKATLEKAEALLQKMQQHL